MGRLKRPPPLQLRSGEGCKWCDRPTYFHKLTRDRFWAEQIHDFFWALNNCAWAAMLPIWWTGSVGVITWILSCLAVISSCHKGRRYSRILRRQQYDSEWAGRPSEIDLDLAYRRKILAQRRSACDVVFLIWMTGNIIWCFAESYTINIYGCETNIPDACFRDIMICFILSVSGGVVLWTVMAYKEMSPTLYRWIWRLNDHYIVKTYIAAFRGDVIGSPRGVPYELEPFMAEPYLKTLISTKGDGRTKQIMVIPLMRNTYDEYIKGVPRFLHGPVKMPPGSVNPKNGKIHTSSKWIILPLFSVLDFRCLIRFVWMIKELCWITYFAVDEAYQMAIIRTVWTVMASLQIIGQLRLIITLVVYHKFRRKFKFLVWCEVNFLLYAIMNSTWAFGELFYSSEASSINGVDPLQSSVPVSERIYPAWTPYDEIGGEGQWKFRQAAQRISTFLYVSMGALGLTLLALDLNRCFLRKRCQECQDFESVLLPDEPASDVEKIW